jgi:hypothetical protein
VKNNEHGGESNVDIKILCLIYKDKKTLYDYSLLGCNALFVEELIMWIYIFIDFCVNLYTHYYMPLLMNECIVLDVSM